MKEIADRYATLLRGGIDKSPLATDGYKFSMAQAGFPLREEVFYLHFRKGGPLFIPFDLAAVVRELCPRLPNRSESSFLETHGYGLTSAMEKALQGDLEIWSQPAKTFAMANEPVLTIKGPSFLVSWLESLVIAFHFPMQVATAMKAGIMKFNATCVDEQKIIYLVAEALGIPNRQVRVTLTVNAYALQVLNRIDALREVVDLDRVFEVGTRAMTCMAQHRIALEVCKEQGINRTADVLQAYNLYMVPVGTTGHEHQERHGGDYNAFRAIRDQRAEPPSYLFDTFNPILGIQQAIKVITEMPDRPCSMRFDSGDQEDQLTAILMMLTRAGPSKAPLFLFMDGYDAKRVKAMETFAGQVTLPENRHYGLGSYLVRSDETFTRDTVAMVYKLCQTGGVPVKKYSGTPGKESLAGDPRVLTSPIGKRRIVQNTEASHTGMVSGSVPTRPAELSTLTQGIQDECRIRDFG